MSASNPLYASSPAMAFVRATCSVSDNPVIAVLICPTMFSKPTNLPLASFIFSPNCSMAIAAAFGGLASLEITDLKLVPMVLACMPLLLMMAIAVPSSSMLIPKAAAGAPAYCIARPKSCIPSLDLLAAICTTSATCVVFSAISPCFISQMDSADVITSDVTAKSSPDATAAVIIPGIAPIVSLTSKPPAASLSMPSAAWLAVIGNSAPSLPATSRILLNSASVVAPALTAAPVIVASKSMKVLPVATPTAVIAAAAGIIDSPMELMPRPTF